MLIISKKAHNNSKNSSHLLSVDVQPELQFDFNLNLHSRKKNGIQGPPQKDVPEMVDHFNQSSQVRDTKSDKNIETPIEDESIRIKDTLHISDLIQKTPLLEEYRKRLMS